MNKDEVYSRIISSIILHINNSATEMIGYTELSKMDLENIETENDAIEHAINSISEALNAGKRMGDTLKKLSLIYSDTDFEIKIFNFSLILKEILKLIRTRLPDSIEMKIEVENDLHAKGNPGFLFDIVTKVIENSVDAMVDTGGRLTVAMKKILNDKNTSGIDAEYIQLNIKDTGKGINENLKKLIFYPFQTANRNKMGIGLSLVKRMVELMAGTITLESSINNGTNVNIVFPIISPSDKRTDTKLIKGTETILLVDDEIHVINMHKSFLELCGYRVLMATNGTTALKKIKKDKVDVLATDMQMPHMNGEQLIENALIIDPDIKCIVLSGYSESRFTKLEKLGIPLIYKPVIGHQLAIMIRKLLD